MSLRDLLGNEGLKRQLTALCAEGSWVHAYVIEGPRGCGKHMLAEFIAACAVCTGGPFSRGAEIPCGSCPSCRKRIREHPDITFIASASATGSIGVSAIRGVQADTGILPNEGARKVYVIEDAGRLTAEAQNALLRVFEEPPAHVMFLLLCESASELLPTVRSRAVRLTLRPLEQADCVDLLRARFPGEAPERIAAAAAFSRGSPGVAAAYLTEEGPEKAAELARRFTELLAGNDCYAFTALLAALPTARLELLRQLSVIELALEDALRMSAGARVPAAVLPADAVYPALTNERIPAILKAVGEAAGRIEGSLTPALVLNVLFIECWEAVH